MCSKLKIFIRNEIYENEIYENEIHKNEIRASLIVISFRRKDMNNFLFNFYANFNKSPTYT
jgi:hypothetical protein